MENENRRGYESLKNKALEQLRRGKSLFGKDGAFAPLLKEFVETALQAELDDYMDDEQRVIGNRKNGHTGKKLKISQGTLEVNTPRDRLSGFEPELIKKRETILAETRHDIERKRHELETEEDHDQVGRGGHEDHAQRREQDQRVKLGLVDVRTLEVIHRQQRCAGRDRQEQEPEKTR